MNNRNRVGVIIRVFLAVVFFVSAISKLISVYNFEAYVTTLKIVPFRESAILARALIGLEFALAVALLWGVFKKVVCLVTTILVAGFSAFLVYQLFTGVEGNCNCFGDFIPMNPLQSLLKNIFLLILLVIQFLIIRGEEEKKNRLRWLSLAVCALGLAIPFCVNNRNLFHSDKDYLLREFAEESESIEKLFKPSADFDVYSGKKLVCILSTNCGYCMSVVQRLTQITRNNNLTDKVLCFFYGKEEDVAKFYEEAESIHFPYRIITHDEVNLMARGRVPKVLLVDDGKVVEVTGYNEEMRLKILPFFGL